MKLESKSESKTKRVVSSFLTALMLTGVGFSIPMTAAADESAAGLQFIIVSDDLRKTTTETERVGDAGGSDSGSDPASPASGSDGNGNGNNGHGNNIDGVDVSNPGQGGGGPNGAVDESGSVDDEAGTGNGGNNANGKGKKK